MKNIETFSEFMLVKLKDRLVLRHYDLKTDSFYKVAEFRPKTELIQWLDEELILFGDRSVYQIVKVDKSGNSRAQWLGQNLYSERVLDDDCFGLKVIEFNPALRQELGFRFLVIQFGHIYCANKVEKNPGVVTIIDIQGKKFRFGEKMCYGVDYESGVERSIEVEQFN